MSLKFRPQLTALDVRIVPDATTETPITPPDPNTDPANVSIPPNPGPTIPPGPLPTLPPGQPPVGGGTDPCDLLLGIAQLDQQLSDLRNQILKSSAKLQTMLAQYDKLLDQIKQATDPDIKAALQGLADQLQGQINAEVDKLQDLIADYRATYDLYWYLVEELQRDPSYDPSVVPHDPRNTPDGPFWQLPDRLKGLVQPGYDILPVETPPVVYI